MGTPLNPFDPENRQQGIISGIINDNTNVSNPALGVSNPNTPIIPNTPGTVGANPNAPLMGSTLMGPLGKLTGWNSQDAIARQKEEYRKMLQAYQPVTSMVSSPTAPATPPTAAPAPTTPTPTLPGYMQGETKEQRQARIIKNRRAKGEIK